MTAPVISIRPAPPPAIPERVSSRQFKMQLELDEILDQVEAWVAAQPRLVQIAYRESKTFDRADAMLQSGFSALGFDAARVDEFFSDAEKL
ncbi:hypothetical protein EDC40_10351 [Aminobacter aminovorans]|uniref:Uncharacterized protein n=1 Tax=Aminobacter aminovorans TaxID=83263 RepID=A0A380WM77_AMIAI|nr:hypothetical protein [Aminobacter aminovorans]TCS27586.1 hypothetical protein EDC40_10351 [Aminobacter aminovorans]SUU90001.1 Uncharacterised protein [Aminobacter aminovorans]